ncbi:MAG TPA: hypothetical protein VFA66_05080 [Gaiellaceae bacterium]|nr:hypothetical protein [Gaiellaceae bacterium]
MRVAIALTATVVAALAAGAGPAGATNECRGLNPCVPIAGPWVVVPVARAVPPPDVQYQLTCPRGFVVGGVDAELTDGAIDVSIIGASGSPVSPGITTSRVVVFVATYTATPARGAPSFKPHAGCVPATGGGQRTPTAVGLVPPGQPTVRRVTTSRIGSRATVTVSCRGDERLVAAHTARAFFTQAPPSPALVASLSAVQRIQGNRVTVVARARQGRGAVQVQAVCAGGR